MAEMTSVERCQTVLDVGIPDRVPVCLLNFMPALLRVGSVGFLGLAGGAAAWFVLVDGRPPVYAGRRLAILSATAIGGLNCPGNAADSSGCAR
jgi:hypothetical protein